MSVKESRTVDTIVPLRRGVRYTGMGVLRAYEEWMYGLGMAVTTVEQRLSFATRILAEWGTFDVTPGHAGAWLRQFGGWTKRTYYLHLSSIFQWQVETGKLDVSPLARIKAPPTPKPAPRPLTWDQVTELVEDATATRDQRMRAWILLGALAGFRVHEMAQHHARDINATNIRILGKGGQLAAVPTHPTLWHLASEMPQDDWWFPSPHGSRTHISASLASLRISELFRRHGITGSAHRLRATYATELQRKGVPLRHIQELLRHENLASTEHYLGVEQNELEAAVRLLAA